MTSCFPGFFCLFLVLIPLNPTSGSTFIVGQCQDLPALIVVAQSLSRIWLFATPWTAVHQASCPSPSLEFAQTHVHWVTDAIQPSHPLLSPSPPAFYLSQHRGIFQWVSYSHQMAKFWSFSFSISPSNEYSGFISFRINWSDLLAVQGTLKSLLQHNSTQFNTICLEHWTLPHLPRGPCEPELVVLEGSQRGRGFSNSSIRIIWGCYST